MSDSENTIVDVGAEPVDNTEQSGADEKSTTLLGGDGKPDSSSSGTADNTKQVAEDKVEEKSEVPEQYELKMPEGVELDREALDVFTPIAKELKLGNEQAQKLADLYAAQMQKVQEAQRENYLKTIEAWEAEAKKDPEIGGDKLQGAIASATRALRAYDTDGSFLKLMDESGFGNHPAVMRFVARVGKALKEDTAETANVKQANQSRDINQILYNKS